MHAFFSKLSLEGVAYAVLLFLIFYFRWIVLLRFGFQYTDSDQAIMWHALENYSAGQFHEPRFYGQAYNTMLEALLAIPLYLTGIPAHKALPVITSLLTLLPYVIISLFTFLKKSRFAALIILSIPLLLPIEYSLITSLSRGFVPGLFIASVGAIALFFPKRRWAFFLLGFCGILGFSVTGNAILVSLPSIFYLFLINRKNPQFYIYTLLGLLLAGIAHFAVNSFYSFHPNYNFHGYTLSFSWEVLWGSVAHVDKFFNDVTPVFWNQGFLLLLLSLSAAIYFLIKGRVNAGLVIFFTLGFIILTLGINKIQHGTESVFFSYARMYLGIPVLLGISLAFLRIKQKGYHYLYFLLPMFLLGFKMGNLDTAIHKNIQPTQNHIAAVAETDYVFRQCKKINQLSAKYDIDLIIIAEHYNYDFYNYACNACLEDFPQTLRPSYERRTWRLIEDENRVYDNIMIINDHQNYNYPFDYIEKIYHGDYRLIICNNKLPTMELLDKLDIKVRDYKLPD